MTNITNYLNKVKTAVYGKDVRGAIHDAIKQVYDDASVNHDNANMEVKLARGTHNTLNDRLDNVDEIQAQTNAQLSQMKQGLDSELSQKTNEKSLYRKKESTINFQGVDLEDMTFKVKNIQRPDFNNCNKLCDSINFYANLFEDVPTDKSNGGTNFFVYPGNDRYTRGIYRKGKQSVKNGILTIKGNDTGGGEFEDFYCPVYKNFFPHAFVELEVDDYFLNTDGGVIGRANPEIVLFEDEINFISIICHLETYGDTKKGNFEVWRRDLGQQLRPQDTPSFDLDKKFKIGVLMMDNHLVIFVKNNGDENWTLVKDLHFEHDFYVEDWSRYTWGFGAFIDEGCTLSIKSLNTYMTPGFGVRDMTLVHYKDGSPYIKDGRYYFTATTGGLTIHSSGSAIMSYDPTTFDVSLECYVYNKYDGGIWPDSQFDVVIDDDTNEIWYYFSTMASISTRYTNDNFVTGGAWRLSKTCVGKTRDTNFEGIIIVDTKIVDQTPETGYDNYTIYNSNINKWVRVATSYDYNNVAIFTADDPLGRWDLKVSKGGFDLTEGPKLAKVNEKWHVLIPYQRNEWRSLNIDTLDYEFTLNTQIMPGHQGPHCMIIPICKNNTTKYQLLSMDGAHAHGFDFSWGGIWFYESDRIAQGYEFAIKNSY